MSQANSIVGSVTDAVCAVNPDFSGQAALRWGLGIGLALLTALVLFGGIKRIGAVTEKLIPFMSVAYILMTLIVIFGNLGGVGRAFKAIFSAAFAPRAILGGAAGITIRQAVIWGLRRSAFSNEAGLGSAPIAHAAAHCDGPVEQGIYGIFEVFMDTIVICTLTALTIIISGVDVTFGVKPGSALITAAFGTVFNGTFSSVFIAVALTLFAYSTILGWSLYGSRCVQYLLGLRAAKVYQFIFIIIIVVGSVRRSILSGTSPTRSTGSWRSRTSSRSSRLSPVIFKITRNISVASISRAPNMNKKQHPASIGDGCFVYEGGKRRLTRSTRRTASLWCFSFVLGGRQPACVQKNKKIPRKSKAVRCEAVLPEQKCSQTRKKAAENTLCILKGFDAV